MSTNGPEARTRPLTLPLPLFRWPRASDGGQWLLSTSLHTVVRSHRPPLHTASSHAQDPRLEAIYEKLDRMDPSTFQKRAGELLFANRPPTSYSHLTSIHTQASCSSGWASPKP